MDGHLDRERAAVEWKDAGLRVNPQADGGGYDQWFVDTSRAEDALHGLNNPAETYRNALKGELRPSG
jgi:hypothetical protein